MGSETQPKRDVYVIARFLEPLLSNTEGMKRTHLANRTGLNYADFKNYLEFLMDRGLLAIAVGEDGRERVAITVEGRRLYRVILMPFAEMLKDPRLLGKPKWLRD
jgi:predicted transcriptional regulator